MRYVLIVVAVLTIVFVKTDIDEFKKPPKYVSENYIGWYPPSRSHSSASTTKDDDSSEGRADTEPPSPKSIGPSPSEKKPGVVSRAPAFSPKQRAPFKKYRYKVSNPAAENQKVREIIQRLPYPAMRAVAYCESTTQHYNPKTGFVLRGRKHNLDTGVFQLNLADTKIRQFLKENNCNAFDPEDNIRCAIRLYEQEGLKPWGQSRICILKNMNHF